MKRNYAPVQRMYQYYKDNVLVAQVTEEDIRGRLRMWTEALAIAGANIRDVKWVSANEKTEAFFI